MHWDDLRIIAAVRSKGSFAKAGKDLHIDETTVARRVLRIQTALGFTLFNAIDGVRKPTAQCKAVLDHVDTMTQAAAKIGAIGSTIDGPVGKIRLTSTATIAEDILAPTLGKFLTEHRGIALELESSNQNLDFSHWEADLAIRLGKPAKGNFIIRKLVDIPLVLFQPKSGAAGQELFVCTYPDDLDHTPEMQELKALGHPEPTRLITSNVRVLRSVVRAGKGIGVLPKYLAADLLNDTTLHATPLKTTREAWLLVQPHLKTDTVARVVIDWIVDQFEDFEKKVG